MRKWTMSACVVLAWSIIVPLLALAGLTAPGHLAQATTSTRNTQAPDTRHTSAILTSQSATARTATAAASAADKPAATWTVRQGDSLSAIATAVGIPGGWQTLYAANRRVIGLNPDVIRPGTVLELPGKQAPMRYTVMPGDTLSRIAAALATPGGWQALYAANRRVIGPDPDVIRPGTVLIPRANTQRPATATPGHNARPPVHAASPRPTASASKPAGKPARQPQSAPTADTFPNWLEDILIAAGLLAAIAFAVEPVAVLTRRRQSGRPARPTATSRAHDPVARARIIFSDHERLIVTYSGQDDTVYVLTPPGEDPMAVLSAARLILPEDAYEDLADRLGVPATFE